MDFLRKVDMEGSLTVPTCYCSPQVLAMNSPGGRKQEAAGPRGRRAHRHREKVHPSSPSPTPPWWEGRDKGTLSPGSLGNAGGMGEGANGSYCSQRPQGLLPLLSALAAGHSEFRVGSRVGSPWEPGATSGLLQDRDVQLSKALSYTLRHGALKLGLPMGAGK